MITDDWSKSSWRKFPIEQQPAWPDSCTREEVFQSLSRLPALVFAGETRELKQKLAHAANGDQFVLQCGDCAEDFSECNGPRIHALLKVILQMSIILKYSGEKKVVTIGRICGQYAKPRSSDTEKVNGIIIPSYRGDMVNSPEPTLEARKPDPKRILDGYFRSTATLNLLRAFTQGGYASLEQVHAWHLDFCDKFPANRNYEKLIKGIRKTIKFMAASEIDIKAPELNKITLYTSHEGLLLEYEEAMTRIDTTTGKWYDTSAHMLWIGDRTRQPDGAHVEFMRGICNPIGIKVGPTYNIDEIKRIAEKINPENQAGRLTLITRFGAEKIESFFPFLLSEIKKEGFKIVWICDPMHGNTYENSNSIKTRKFDDILMELKKFFQIHASEGTVAGGVHLELTGDNVTECIGGNQKIIDNDLHKHYKTHCDPRLNAAQAVELSFKLTEILNH